MLRLKGRGREDTQIARFGRIQKFVKKTFTFENLFGDSQWDTSQFIVVSFPAISNVEGKKWLASVHKRFF